MRKAKASLPLLTYLLGQELSIQELLEGISVVRVEGVDVQAHGVEVAAEDQQPLRQLHVVLL